MTLIEYSPSHFNDLKDATENAEHQCAVFYFYCVSFVLIILCYKNLCEIARNSILHCYFIFHFWNKVENHVQNMFKFEWLGSLNGFTWLSWQVLFKKVNIPRDNKSCFYPSSFTILLPPSPAGRGVSEWLHRA